jgi:PII-like signaling protein
VDSLEKINALLPHLEEMMRGGLVTLERVQVIRYEQAPQKRRKHLSRA